MILGIKKDEKGKLNINFNLIPKFNISFIFQLAAILSSWALHESIIRSLLAYIFGFVYLILWAIFGDSATKDGVEFIINYYKEMFN